METQGYPIRTAELLATLDGAAYVARRTLHDVRGIRMAKRAIRTAFEVQTISAELLENHRFARYLPKDRALRILDLGSGTGGAWMGFIYGLCRAAGVREIHIHTIDGNPTALAKQAGAVCWNF